MSACFFYLKRIHETPLSKVFSLDDHSRNCYEQTNLKDLQSTPFSLFGFNYDYFDAKALRTEYNAPSAVLLFLVLSIISFILNFASALGVRSQSGRSRLGEIFGQKL